MNNYIEKRPWGSFEIISQLMVEGGDVCVKVIRVNPKARLSYQLHQHRTEHWTIIQGSGAVIVNDMERTIKAADFVEIPVGTKHRIINTHEAQELTFVEVSTGHFDENDIVRYQDDFGRVQ